MAFNPNTNKRVFYATQGVAIGDMGASGVKDAWGTSTAGDDFIGSGNMIIMHGLQSVGVNTNFSLEAVQELGQLSIYENVEEVPDIEATFERVLDGYTMAYHAATIRAEDPTLSGRANARADLRMVIGLDTKSAVSSGDSLAAELYCSGMYWSSVSINLPTDGNFTESLTLVGNNKKWIAVETGSLSAGILLGASGAVNSVFAFGDDSPDSPDGGVLRRNNFLTGSGTVARGSGNFVTVVPDFITGVSNNGGISGATGASSFRRCGTINTDNVHIQSISFSVDAGREAINQLGTYAPYYRYVNFPVNVTTEIQVIAVGGDNINAVEDVPSGGNLSNHTIQVCLNDSTVIQVGNKNKLTSVSYGGGDAGGGNATITYSMQNNNDFVILHSGDPMTYATNTYWKYWFT
jgi:hypothetical protein